MVAGGVPVPVVTPAATPFRMPSPATATPGHDLIAIGADLAPGTMLAGLRGGLFPLPVDPHVRRSKVAWYSPDPRGVLPLDSLRVSRSLGRSMRRFDVRFDDDFAAVVRGCADPSRRGRWLTDEFVGAYRRLHLMGWAHSVSVRDDDGVAGGLFGVRIDGFFSGISMFHRESDASKVALVHLVDWLRRRPLHVEQACVGLAQPCSTCSGRRRISGRSERSRSLAPRSCGHLTQRSRHRDEWPRVRRGRRGRRARPPRAASAHPAS